MPVTIKDVIKTAGIRTEMGSWTRQGHVPSFDAPLATRLDHAGAIRLGKTTTSEFGWKGVSQSPLTGITSNPWRDCYNAGASSCCADAKYTEDHRRKPQAEIDDIAHDQASVFTEDAQWDNGLFGRFEGRQAIWAFLRATPWKFSVHMFVNPLIQVHGDTATGSWVIWEVATLQKSDQAVFLAATLDDDYVNLGGRWFTRRTRMTNRFMTPFHEPWTVRRNAPYTG